MISPASSAAGPGDLRNSVTPAEHRVLDLVNTLPAEIRRMSSDELLWAAKQAVMIAAEQGFDMAYRVQWALSAAAWTIAAVNRMDQPDAEVQS